MSDEKAKTAAAVKHKTLEEAYNEPCTILMNRSQMHQAFQLFKAGTESSLNPGRPGLKDLKLGLHPLYGLIGCLNNQWFVAPNCPNAIVAYE